MTTPKTGPLIDSEDIYLFNEGNHFALWQILGAHPTPTGTRFAVWAPNAKYISVIGDFNGWDRGSHPLRPVESSGIWAGHVDGVGPTTIYKYFVDSRVASFSVDKADPFAFHAETPPKTGSIVWDLDYEWGDRAWMSERGARQSVDAPMSVYELHFGSWRRTPDETAADSWRWLTYTEMGEQLADYALDMGYTHVEFLPLTEHPFYGSWGYQTTGYFAPTSRYGTPQQLKTMIDTLHAAGIGVIVDWVPSHFPSDEHGLVYFDGTHLYEHADPREGYHPDWSSYIFNYGRNEVRAFLISSALFWLEEYHVDGLRVDAVASMLYRDYSRKQGEWIPNEYGGRENLEAMGFLREMNTEVYRREPDVHTTAEESTSWPGVSKPVYAGGLGFGYKWDMGWMHDTLEYFSQDPVYRQYRQGELTFRMLYAFTENFVLSLSHDEVTHGKGSMLTKMPGDDWQQAANLRLLYGYMYGQPGKKLLFMGSEIGVWDEWNHESAVDFHLLEWQPHAGLAHWIRDLNRTYRDQTALHQLDCDPGGFEWIDASDSQNSVISVLRKGRADADVVLVICNFTPVARHDYRIGVPYGGLWREVLNSDAETYGGSGVGNMGEVVATPTPEHGRSHSVVLSLPPLGALFLAPEAIEVPTTAETETTEVMPEEILGNPASSRRRP